MTANDQSPTPLILPDNSEDKKEPQGVLDNVERRITVMVATDGNVTFAIGKALNPFEINNVAFLLTRIANRMVDNIEAKMMQDAADTARVMQSLAKGRGPTDEFKRGGDRR